MGLEGKVALVTGGANGLGRATSLRLASEGATILIADLSEKDGKDACRHISRSCGSRPLFFRVDVSSEKDVISLMKEVKGKFGKLDILVANAGTEQKASAIVDLDQEEWDRVTKVNAKGAFLCCKHGAREMIRSGVKGKIVLVSSVNSGRSGAPLYGAYAASKSAIIGLGSTLCAELAPYGINVNIISPGIIDTEMLMRIWKLKARKIKKPFEQIAESGVNSVPLKRLGKPEDVANCIAFLVSDHAEYINGAVIDITGGLREAMGGRG